MGTSTFRDLLTLFQSSYVAQLTHLPPTTSVVDSYSTETNPVKLNNIHQSSHRSIGVIYRVFLIRDKSKNEGH